MCLRMLLLEVNSLQVDTVVVCPIELEKKPRNSSNLKSPQTETLFLRSTKYLLSEAFSILPTAKSWLLCDPSSSQASVQQLVHTNIYLRVGAQH